MSTHQPLPSSDGESVVLPQNDLDEVSSLGRAGDDVFLVGTKCMQCGQLMLGQRLACSGCMSPEVAETALAREGEVYSWTEVHVMAGRPEPVYLAYLDLTDGVRVLSELKLGRAPRIGERLTLTAGGGDEWWFGSAASHSEPAR